MSIFIENFEQYSVINLSDGEVVGTEAIQALQELTSQDTNAVLNLVMNLKEIAHLNSEGMSLVKKAAQLIISREGIFIVAGADMEMQKELENMGMAENITFLPTVAEGVDAVFFHDLEKQFGLEGGDLNLL